MNKTTREELERIRDNLVKENGEKMSDQDMKQLEAEISELSNIIIDAYLGK